MLDIWLSVINRQITYWPDVGCFSTKLWTCLDKILLFWVRVILIIKKCKVSPQRDVTLLARRAVSAAHCVARQPAALKMSLTGYRHQRAKQCWPIRRASRNMHVKNWMAKWKYNHMYHFWSGFTSIVIEHVFLLLHWAIGCWVCQRPQ